MRATSSLGSPSSLASGSELLRGPAGARRAARQPARAADGLPLPVRQRPSAVGSTTRTRAEPRAPGVRQPGVRLQPARPACRAPEPVPQPADTG